MTLEEMFQGMSSGKMKAHSELGTRDESKQTRNNVPRIQKMKTTTGINARALLMKDVVLPFNPFTGEPDDTYNEKKTYRPILLVSQVISVIKMACKENSELAAKWKEILGIEFSDGAPTMDEYFAFRAHDFIKTRIMSYATVPVNFNGLQGFPQYKVRYSVDPTQLNERNTYDYGPSAPIWHQAFVFFAAILGPEATDAEKALRDSGANTETISNERQKIFSKAPVGQVRPSNLVPFFFFPHGEPIPKFDPKNPRDMESHIRYYGYVDKWTVPMDEVSKNPMFDTDMDFYDFTIKTPDKTATKKNGAVYTDDDSLEIYQAMQITNTDGRLALHGGSTVVNGQPKRNEEVFAGFYEAARAYFMYSQEQSAMENGETFEKIVTASNQFRPITSVLDRFLPACREVFNAMFANSKYYTESVRNANSTFLVQMAPENAMLLAGEDEEDLQAAEKKQKASIEEIMAETRVKSYDGMALEEDDGASLTLDDSEEE